MITRKIYIKIFVLICLIMICISLLFVFIRVKSLQSKKETLIGKIVYIDAGHGGKDDGASVDGVLEDQVNLKISVYLTEILINMGAYVLTSRTDDCDLASLYQKNRKREDLGKRVNYINKSKPDIFISIHLNTYPSEKVQGAQVFYQNSEESKVLANVIQSELNVLTSKQRKTKRGDYFLLNKTIPVGVIIECGFLSNSIERQKLSSDEYQKKIAKQIQKGIVNYFSRTD